MHIWLHLPQAQRDRPGKTWMPGLNPLTQALASGAGFNWPVGLYRKQTSLNGFYQDNSGDADFAAPESVARFTALSANFRTLSRFAIRFMPLDTENGQVPERLDFELGLLLEVGNSQRLR
ncbi:cell division protein ZapD [Shigella flexneri]